MSTRITIITVFFLGLIVGVLLTLMWLDRNGSPPTQGTTQADWRRPMATRRAS